METVLEAILEAERRIHQKDGDVHVESVSFRNDFGIPVVTLASNFAQAQSKSEAKAPAGDWPAYGHDAAGTRYSPLTQINRDNVANLKVAWTFHVEDISDGSGGRKRSGLETTPILVDGTLFLTSGFNRVFALDPETGKQRWVYDPLIDTTVEYGDGLINRGVATWVDASRAAGAAGKPCRRRIYEATLDARLIALDGATGIPCADFGSHGQVSLRNVARYRSGWYHMTSAPTVIGDVVVVGSAIDDNARVDMASGEVRGFNARTGALIWKWEPLPPNADPKTASGDAKNIWKTGAGNAWSGIVADPVRDLAFVPTGSPSPDYFGGHRVGDDKWANSVVALRGKTGEFVWGFQLVHHDLWELRLGFAAAAGDDSARRKTRRGSGAGKQDGFFVCAGSRKRGVRCFRWKSVRCRRPMCRAK